VIFYDVHRMTVAWRRTNTVGQRRWTAVVELAMVLGPQPIDFHF